MNSNKKTDDDRRVKRTKGLVFDAFFDMVQSTRYDQLKVKDIIARADIGRSTFYEHFSDKDDLLSQSLEYPMSIFAIALAGGNRQKDLIFMLSHFWERRLFARLILKHPTREVVDGCLRKFISSKLRALSSMNEQTIQAHATFLSAGFLGLLNEWLIGRSSFTVEQMAEYVTACSPEI